MDKNGLYSKMATKYPSGVHHYINVDNYLEQYKNFLESGFIQNPIFTYKNYPSRQYLQDRLQCLNSDVEQLKLQNQQESAEYDATVEFILRRIKETQLIESHLNLLEDYPNNNQSDVEGFHHLNQLLYGVANKAISMGIIRKLQNSKFWSESNEARELLENELNLAEPGLQVRLYAPSAETFNRYKEMFRQSLQEFDEFINSLNNKTYNYEQIVDAVKKGLESINALEAGWRVAPRSHMSDLKVSVSRKIIYVGKNVHPRSAKSLRRLIAHEIGCHVLRSNSGARWQKLEKIGGHEEGLALLLEQLIEDKFIHRRTMRYLATSCALAVGAKEKLDFVKTFKIIRAALIVLGNKNVDRINRRAFYEAFRIFRGGLPNVPGIVFRKDLRYLVENLEVWQKLEEEPIDQNQFRALFVNGG